MQSLRIWKRFCALAGFPMTLSQTVDTENTPSLSNGSANVKPRCLTSGCADLGHPAGKSKVTRF